MKKAILPVIFFFGFFAAGCGNQSSQKKIIRATSESVDIRDGSNFYSSTWRIVPDLKPDVYTSENASKIITFYTDVDSISIKVEPNQTYDFYIILNEKDTAWTQIQMVPSRLETLKKAGEYNTADNRPIPEWTYLPQNNANLKKIRKHFNLDSIAGNGDEISRIKNLMYWLHNTVRHDGSSDNPSSKNAIDIVELCRKEGRGVNCRMLATVLNECYLAMGFKSRFITCMPRELEFEDCHVINMVYSNDLGKWVWMDPSFAAYVEDENGTLLSIEEVRQRLIDDKPLVLNPDANWNHETPQTKEFYLEKYMAKNLYRFQCPSASTYNTETWPRTEVLNYIELVPLDALNQSPQKEEIKSKDGKVVRVEYLTNNPVAYWAAPK